MHKLILSRSQNEKIRNVHFYSISFYEKNGIPVDSKGEKVVFPSLEELEKMAIEQILQLGFREVKRISPDNANCVIRLFYKWHHPFVNEMHNLCGFNCFTKKFHLWLSNSEKGDDFELDFSKCINRQWLYQDEYIDYDCNFFDIYTQIS